MKRQEIPILRDNEIPSAQSYNALAAPIRNIKSLTPETLRITQNPSNGGLQFEVPPYARQAATGSSDEEKTPVELNCSFAISVEEKKEDGSYPVTVSGGNIYTILLDYYVSSLKYTFDTTINKRTWIYIKIIYKIEYSNGRFSPQCSASIYTTNSEISATKTATLYYVLLGIVDADGKVLQYQVGDIFLPLPLSYVPTNRNTAYIEDGKLYLMGDLGGSVNCIIACDGKTLVIFDWSGQYIAQGNYGVYYYIEASVRGTSKMVYIDQASATDSDTSIYVPLVLLNSTGTQVTFIAPQYINIGGRWV